MEVSLINGHDLTRGMLRCDLAAKACVTDDLGLGPRTVRDRQRVELKHLHAAMKSGHISVLEHCALTFAIEGISRACSHQLVRHRLASYSQQSQRYVNMDGFEYVTPKSIRAEDYDMVMVEYEAEEECAEFAFFDIMRRISALYKELIKNGVPEEDARYILPNACCTNIVVTMNARELRHFLGLRLCSRAQWEIRELAERMLELLKEECPVLFEDVGPQCEQLGYCPEEKGCGRYPDLYGLGEEYWIGHGDWKSS